MSATQENTGVTSTVAFAEYGTAIEAEVIEITINNLESPAPVSKKGYIFTIDVSGSMDGDRLNAVKAGIFAQLVFLVKEISGKSLREVQMLSDDEKTSYLTPKHLGHMSFVTFSSRAQVVWDNANFTKNPWHVINNIDATGGTNLYAGVELTLAQVQNANVPCTVVILTDGAANEGFTNKSQFENIYSKFPLTTNMISVGVGNGYCDQLINIEPLQFNHAQGQTELIELAGNVLQDFINSYGHSANIDLDGIFISDDSPSDDSILVGSKILGTLIHGTERTLVMKPFGASDDPEFQSEDHIDDNHVVYVSYRTFDGEVKRIASHFQRIDNVTEKTIRAYYSAEAVKLCAMLVKNRNNREIQFEESIAAAESVMKQWNRDYADDYRSTVNDVIRKIKTKKISQEEVSSIGQASTFSSSQTSYTSSSAKYSNGNNSTPSRSMGVSSLSSQVQKMAKLTLTPSPSR